MRVARDPKKTLAACFTAFGGVDFIVRSTVLGFAASFFSRALSTVRFNNYNFTVPIVIACAFNLAICKYCMVVRFICDGRAILIRACACLIKAPPCFYLAPFWPPCCCAEVRESATGNYGSVKLIFFFSYLTSYYKLGRMRVQMFTCARKKKRFRILCICVLLGARTSNEL